MSMFNFEVVPKEQRNVESNILLSEGQYYFVINSAAEHVSKAGNCMIKLSFDAYQDGSGSRSTRVFDYLMGKGKGTFKIKALLDSLGMFEVYDQGELDLSLLPGKSGQVRLGIQRDVSGAYPDKNIVRDYVARTPSNVVSKGDEFDDDMPF